jgi:hypothetical protein
LAADFADACCGLLLQKVLHCPHSVLQLLQQQQQQLLALLTQCSCCYLARCAALQEIGCLNPAA